MKKLTLLFLLLGCLLAFARPTQRTITGTVYDKKDHKPIPGASIRVVGKSVGTVANAQGQYSIILPEGSNKLLVSYIGYQKQQITIAKGEKLEIYLSAAAK